MSTQGIKYAAMAAALLAGQALLQRAADVYGKLDSQDAAYRDVQQQFAVALALPEDAAPEAPAPEAPAVPDLSAPVADLRAQVDGVAAALAAGLAGIEDHLGVLIAALPAPVPAPQ